MKTPFFKSRRISGLAAPGVRTSMMHLEKFEGNPPAIRRCVPSYASDLLPRNDCHVTRTSGVQR